MDFDPAAAAVKPSNRDASRTPNGTLWPLRHFSIAGRHPVGLRRTKTMGRGILLWLLGVPIPIILLILLFWH